MGTLQIGRVTSLADPSDWNVSARPDQTMVSLSGWLTDSTLDARNAKATELEQQVGRDVPVVFSSDATLNGFYRLVSARVERRARTRPGSTTGGYWYQADLEKYGTAQRVEATSLIGGLRVLNDYGIDDTEEKYAWAPPVGSEAVSNAGSPTGHTRTTTDGDIEVYVGVDRTLSPTWICDPDKYYDGGVEIVTGGHVRGGLDTPEDLTGWKVRNKLIEVFADGANDGVINVQTAADQTPYGFKIMFEKTTAIPAWNYPSIVRNDAEMGVLRLTRDANENPPTDSLHDIYITMRRGFPFAWVEFNWSGGATTWSVERESTDAASSVTPTGGTAGMAIRHDSDDADGNRWFLGGFDHDATDLANGALDWDTNTNKFVFVVGMEIGGGSAATLDAVTALMPQACGWLGETVRQSRR